MPQHPHVAQGWTIYAQTMQGPNLEECRHLMAGGLTPYTNQHGSGYRCGDCGTKWFRKLNGEQVVTSGSSRFRMQGWHPAMPATGRSARPPPLTNFLTWAQIEQYNQDRVDNELEVVQVDPEATDVDGNRRDAGARPAA